MNENSITLEELHPTYQLLARIIGIENALKLGRELGGGAIYLPKIDGPYSPFIPTRNRQIIEDLKTSGATVPSIARKYKLSSRYVYELFAREMKAARENG